MLEILMHLFERYLIALSLGEVDQDEIINGLEKQGCDPEKIERTFEWLADLAVQQDQLTERGSSRNNVTARVYSMREKSYINTEYQGFLMMLEQQNIIDSDIREIIIDRLIALYPSYFEMQGVLAAT